jgi:phage terminase large subunit GpA-like protein
MTIALSVPRSELAARAARREAKVLASVFRPPVRMTGTQWADGYRYLSPESSAVPGKFDSGRAPYQREMLDAMSDPMGGRVVMMIASQLGKTELVNNAIGQRMHLRPGPILVLQPTLEMAEAWSKDRLAPMVRDTPVLRRLVKDPRARDSGNTLLHKNFTGGHLTVVGANSPAGLASRPIRDVFCDEVDRYPASAGAEGDPVSLAFRRTATFGNAMHVLISTPTIKGQSRIEKAFNESDQRHYYVPCPHCGEFQELVWGGRDVAHGMKWEPEKPETAYYVCEPSGCEIEEMYKPQMLARGEWRAHNPGHPTRGFFLPGYYSPFDGARWGKLVAEFLEVKADPIRLRTFVNTVLCQTWEDAGEQVEAHVLVDRMEQYPAPCPAGVGGLVRTVDTQGDRLETAVWGFGEGEEAWPIEHEIIPGDPGIPEGSPNSPWNELGKIVDEPRGYAHASGTVLRPLITGIDAGGHHSKNVYAFTRKRQHQRVFALHGSTVGQGVPLLTKPTRNNSARAILYSVGVFTAKEAIMVRLAKIREPGPGYIHIPDWIDSELLAQFTAEKLITKIVGGIPKRVWIKTRDRNEFLDLFVYALGMLHALGLPSVRGLGARARAMIDAATERATKEESESPAKDPEPPSRPKTRPRRGWMRDF